jgi:hypothetical protein
LQVQGSLEVMLPTGTAALEAGLQLLGEECVTAEDVTADAPVASRTLRSTCCNVPIILFDSEQKGYCHCFRGCAVVVTDVPQVLSAAWTTPLSVLGTAELGPAAKLRVRMRSHPVRDFLPLVVLCL